jgi:cytochrome o ubiquinol oxidase subunit 2
MVAWKRANLVRKLFKLIPFLAVGWLLLTLTGCQSQLIGLLNPKGIVAYEERKLFFDTLALMLIVVLPVIIMSFAFIYHYQISHRIQDYKPNWSHSYFLEALWWGIPCAIILVLSVLTWKKTHQLDPYHKIYYFEKNTMVIQVIALPWKWLFIYPEQNIATVNYLVIPIQRQVEYQLTTDNVPMSAFFIPQLGSQLYAMAGMRTRLHLVANEPGTFDGMNTQFNGDGFSEMHFTVQAVPDDELQKWFIEIKKSPNHLTSAQYLQLLKPSIGDKPSFYSGVEKDLFQQVITTYMTTFGTVHPRGESQKPISNSN